MKGGLLVLYTKKENYGNGTFPVETPYVVVEGGIFSYNYENFVL